MKVSWRRDDVDEKVIRERDQRVPWDTLYIILKLSAATNSIEEDEEG
jgi:hypothetical protein